MSLKVRSILVVVIGTVLGLSVSILGPLLTRLEAHTAERVAIQQEEDQYIATLAEVIRRVRREYVDSIDEKTLMESAIRGIVEQLDPHSRYLDSNEYQDILITTTGNYSGVGLDVSMRDGRVTVVSSVNDAPAARAGILAGDVVVSVNDMPVDVDNVEETVALMRGEPGTEVKLGVERGGEDQPLSFLLTRAEIQVHTVRGEYLGDGYGYVRLSGFADTTPAELDDVAAALGRDAGDGLKGLVLDLRDNPGGVLTSAIDVADRFLDAGLIVRGHGRVRQSRFEQHAKPGDALETVPLAVLVNGGSASGSEILAGAIKDHGRGMLVGERTYGKGSVQTVVPLGQGSAIKLTTAHYLTPSGRSINGIGIEPDRRVLNSDPTRLYRGADSGVAIEDDEQLTEALRLIGYHSIALSQAR